MKLKLIPLALFALTAATVALSPTFPSIGAVVRPPVDPVTVQLPPVNPLTNIRPRIDVAFVLDTTGSMSGLIQTAKDKIWSIASTMAAADPAPEIRMGLVAYRDRGDAYVTRVIDLSNDLDAMHAALMELRADGGGDGPESVNQALADAIHRISWNPDPDTYKVVFLVGDAPPHMDYANDVKYPKTIAAARQAGIVVNAVQCGQNGDTARAWERIAGLGDGRYFQVEQAGGAVAIATPYDEKLAELSRDLDGTRVYYGTDTERKERQKKLDTAATLHATASVESRARRAGFNASASGADNFLGDGELVDDVESGRVDLDAVEPGLLPEPMQAMAPAEREAMIRETADRRRELRHQVQELAAKRSAYLNEKVEEMGGAKDSLDQQLYEAVKAQGEAKGLRYRADGPIY